MNFRTAGVFSSVVILLAVVAGCVSYGRLDADMNQWLGKSKDERIKRVGPATQCTRLMSGEEVCEWFRSGAEEHHTIFTYDRDSIAREWSYWGALGKRSSKDAAQEAIAFQATTGASSSQADSGELTHKVSKRRSPTGLAFFGVPLEAGSREELHAAIMSKGGKLVARLQSPEHDEYDSSSWIDSSNKVGAIYTKAGQLVGISVWYAVANQEDAIRLTVQLRKKVEQEFGVPTTEETGWPVLYGWETNPISAGVLGEGKAELSVALIFVFPEREAKLRMEPGYKSTPVY